MFTKNQLAISAVLFPLVLNSDVFKEDWSMAKGLHMNGLEYFVHSAKQWAYSEAMLSLIKKIIGNTKEHEWMIESYWLDGGALAAAKAKRLYPSIKTIVRAHSIEIDPIKNKYCYLEYKEYIDRNIGKLVFISQAGMMFYEQHIRKNFKSSSKRAILRYIRLGSKKRFDGLNAGSADGVFRIVSCSRVEPVKRVGMIAESLALIKNKRIEWSHIGTGSDMINLQDEAETLNQLDNIKCTLLGDFTPIEVQQYLRTQPVDLFINVSSSEGVPVSIMEAQSYGIPVLATDVGGNKEIVDQRSGYLVKGDISKIELSHEIATIIKERCLDDTSKAREKNNVYSNWNKLYNAEACFEQFIAFAME